MMARGGLRRAAQTATVLIVVMWAGSAIADGAAVDKPPLLLVSNSAANSVSYVDPARGVVARVEVGAAPWGIALTPDGTAYVATADGVAVVDTVRRKRTALIPYQTTIGEPQPQYGEYRPGGMGVAVDPVRNRVYVGVYRPDQSSQVEVIDVGRRQVIADVPVGVRPFQVLVSADGRRIYSIDHDSFTVTVIDAKTLEPRTVDAAPLGYDGFDKPHYAALDQEGRLLLPYQGRLLLRLDPRTGETESTPLTANTHQHGVALTPDGAQLFIVGTGPAGSAGGGPNLDIVDVKTGNERLIPVSRPHEMVALSPDGKTAYLTGGYTFANQGWDGVTVVNLGNGAISEIPVPERPLDIVVLDEE